MDMITKGKRMPLQQKIAGRNVNDKEGSILNTTE
jgi:hypothetical protein